MPERVHGVTCPMKETGPCHVLLQPVKGSLAQGVSLHLQIVHGLPPRAAADITAEAGYA